MNNVNKTLYIPLYGKAYVSKKGIILSDKKAEEIWKAEGFELKGKSKSKWLAYYMGMRSAVFDNWLREQMRSDFENLSEISENLPWKKIVDSCQDKMDIALSVCADEPLTSKTEKNTESVILHIGCGMDSRIERVGANQHDWYDVDFPDVICERKKYYQETLHYHMIEADVRKKGWLTAIPKAKHAIVVMEGVSMYFQLNELKQVLTEICKHFEQVHILMDCYTVFAAKASKYKNPINNVGVSLVYGIDEPKILEIQGRLSFVKEHKMTPEILLNELQGMERVIFQKIYGGSIAKKMYRLYEYAG